MKVLDVLDHPYGAGRSETSPRTAELHGRARSGRMCGLGDAGHEVELIDLIEDGFNPVGGGFSPL
jgi:hypothetical protein